MSSTKPSKDFFESLLQVFKRPQAGGTHFELTVPDVTGTPTKLSFQVGAGQASQTIDLHSEGEVFQVGGQTVQNGRITVVGDEPVEIDVADSGVGLSMRAVGTQAPPSSKARRTSRISALLVLGMLLSGVSTDFLVRQANTSFVVAIEPEEEGQSDQDMPQIMLSFAEKLDRADLADAVFMQPNQSDKSLLVTGTIPAAKASEWEGLLRWYDAQNATGTLVTNVSHEATHATLPNVAMVKLNDTPKVVLSNGRSYMEGDQMGALTLVEIDAQMLTFSRGHETLSMPLKARP